MFVASFKNVTPSARFDGRAWTEVKIEEAAEEAGPYVEVETQALEVPDPNPEVPATRNLTTNAASLEAGVFKLTFLDAAGGTDAPQFFDWPPMALSASPVPTLDEMRARSKLLAKRYPSPAGDAGLQALQVDAVALISNLTGRNLGIEAAGAATGILSEGSWEPWQEFGGGEDFLARLSPVPGRLIAVAKRAVTLKCERLAVGGSVRERVQAANASTIRSFTAGPYSESRVNTGELRAKMMLDPDAALDDCLRLLMSEDGWAVWLYEATGQQMPGVALTAFDGLKVPGSYESRQADNWFGLY